MRNLLRLALIVFVFWTLAACERRQPVFSHPPATANPTNPSHTPARAGNSTRTYPIVATAPPFTPSIAPSPTIQFFPRQDGWVEFRNTRIGYSVAFPTHSRFEYVKSQQRLDPNFAIDHVIIWPKGENVSGGLFIEINSMTNNQQLSAVEYFKISGFMTRDSLDTTVNNSTPVDLNGFSGVKFTTMAIADQYMILVPYKDYMVRLVVVLGSPLGPSEMTPDDNQFMDLFLQRLTFNH
jgi:hypothetical protein